MPPPPLCVPPAPCHHPLTPVTPSSAQHKEPRQSHYLLTTSHHQTQARPAAIRFYWGEHVHDDWGIEVIVTSSETQDGDDRAGYPLGKHIYLLLFRCYLYNVSFIFWWKYDWAFLISLSSALGCKTYFWGMDFKFFNILSAFFNFNNTTQNTVILDQIWQHL